MSSMRSNHDFVLFDLNGTPGDPLVGIGRAINYALAHRGYEPVELTQLAVPIGLPWIWCSAPSPASKRARITEVVVEYRERHADV